MPGPASTSPIVLDVSPVVVVITCTDHPWWSAMRWTRSDAFDVAVTHEQRYHPEDVRMAARRRNWRTAHPTRRESRGTSR